MAFLDIQPLTAEQLPAATELDRLCLGGLWTLEGYQRELDSPNSDLLGLWQLESLGAAESSAIAPLARLIGLGCLWAILEEAHITILAIHPNYQRQGLGQVLLHALLSSAWQRHLEWATLEVRVSNEAAISLYEKFGFQEAGRRRRYYEHPTEDALILWRGGLQKPEFQTQLSEWERQICDRLQQNRWQRLHPHPDSIPHPPELPLSLPPPIPKRPE